MLVKDKKSFDIGIWSSQGLEDSQTMVSKLFNRYLSQLLFVQYTDRDQIKNTEFEDPMNTRPMPMVRNLANVWAKYP